MPQGNGYIDSDGHVIEPADLWERYLDPEFREEMPSHDLGYRALVPAAFALALRPAGLPLPPLPAACGAGARRSTIDIVLDLGP